MKTNQHRMRFFQRLTLGGLVATAGLGLFSAMPVLAYELVPPWQIAQGNLYASEAGKFAIAFPNEPEVSVEDDDIGGDSIQIHLFESLTTTSQYMVAYADLPEAYVSQDSIMVLDELRDYILEDIGMDELAASEIDVQLSDHPGRRYRYGDDDSTIDMRLYLVDQRAYLLVAADNNETDVDRFIGSFALR